MNNHNLSILKSFDGTRIFYKKNLFNNSKPTLLFLHGFGGDLGAWKTYQNHLNKDKISNIAIDLRGHGYSDRSENYEFYNLDNFIKDIELLVQKEDLQNIILVGHCFGGMLSLLIELDNSKLSDKLILISTSYKLPYYSKTIFNLPFSFSIIKSLTSLLSSKPKIKHTKFSNFNYNTDLDFTRFVNDIKTLSPRSYFYVLENLLSYNFKEYLSKVSKPTLILQGEKDIIVPMSYANYLNEHIKNSKVVILKNEHHVPVLNNSDLVLNEILSFI